MAEYLFGSEDPVGKIVRIKRAPFTVVGVLEWKGQSPNGQDQDDMVILPVTTLLKKLSGSAHSGRSVSCWCRPSTGTASRRPSGR